MAIILDCVVRAKHWANLHASAAGVSRGKGVSDSREPKPGQNWDMKPTLLPRTKVIKWWEYTVLYSMKLNWIPCSFNLKVKG